MSPVYGVEIGGLLNKLIVFQASPTITVPVLMSYPEVCFEVEFQTWVP